MTSFFEQHMPLFASISVVIGIMLMVWSIRSLLKMLKAAELARLPLKQKQELNFSVAGPVVLCVEGPLLTRRFSHLRFTLHTEYGATVPVKNHWYRVKSSGFSKVRLQLQTYQLPHPGRYQLHIESLGEAQPNDAMHAIVFAKPHLAANVGYILTMVLALWLLIGGIVLFAFSITT